MQETVDPFWRDPPWRGGRTPFRMGLAEIPEAEWLPEPIAAPERERKRALMRERGDEVLARAPGAALAEREAVAAVRETLGGRGGYGVESRAMSLDEAALWVPEDLCVLAPGDREPKLVAACLCSPSYWRLREKIGRPMREIHAPVPGLNRALGARVARFLAGLPVGRIFARRNYLIHRSAEPFQPAAEQWSYPLEPAACRSAFVRSETQTLRRFPGGAVLFSIRVRSRPLTGIEACPQAAADLLAALARMSDDERRAFGYHHHGEALRVYLGDVVAGAGR